MTKRLSSLRDSAGAVTVELALVAPILAAMLVGLVDISRAYSSKLQLEQAAQRTVERVMQKSFKSTDAATLQTEAQTTAGAGSTATVTYWLECNSVKQTATTAWASGVCPSGEQIGRYVQVSISKTHTALIWNQTWAITGVAGIRVQ
jgi:Flp pilus assembly protein TadG